MKTRTATPPSSWYQVADALHNADAIAAHESESAIAANEGKSAIAANEGESDAGDSNASGILYIPDGFDVKSWAARERRQPYVQWNAREGQYACLLCPQIADCDKNTVTGWLILRRIPRRSQAKAKTVEKAKTAEKAKTVENAKTVEKSKTLENAKKFEKAKTLEKAMGRTTTMSVGHPFHNNVVGTTTVSHNIHHLQGQPRWWNNNVGGRGDNHLQEQPHLL